MRYSVPNLNLGEIPFNCNFNYDLPENVKTACKARFISCTLGFSVYALPFIYILVGLSEMLLGAIKRIFNNLQRKVGLLVKMLLGAIKRIFNNLQRKVSLLVKILLGAIKRIF